MAKGNLQQVRIVAHYGDKWHVNPPLKDVETSWKIWAYGRKHLARLQGDPREYRWINPTSNKFVDFLQYSVKLGRSILDSTNLRNPPTFVHWP